MKTVQEYLKDYDVEKLIAAYIEKYPVSLNEISEENLTIAETKSMVRDKLRKFILRLQTVETEKSQSGKSYILFAHSAMKERFAEDEYSLVCVQDLFDGKETAQCYAYEYTKQAEIMGFMVSGDAYTQGCIVELLVDVLYEASFFGFEQEELQEDLLQENTKKENREEVCFSHEELMGQLGLEGKEEDEEEQRLQKQAIAAMDEYDIYCREQQINELKKLLEIEECINNLLEGKQILDSEGNLLKTECNVFWSVDDSCLIAEVAGLPGCVADGESKEELCRNVEKSIDLWLEVNRERKQI